MISRKANLLCFLAAPRKWHEKFCNRKIFLNLICVFASKLKTKIYPLKVSELPSQK